MKSSAVLSIDMRRRLQHMDVRRFWQDNRGQIGMCRGTFLRALNGQPVFPKHREAIEQAFYASDAKRDPKKEAWERELYTILRNVLFCLDRHTLPDKDTGPRLRIAMDNHRPDLLKGEI